MQQKFYFKSPKHRERFLAAVQNKVFDDKLDPEYGAALYILTADLSTWEQAQAYITHNGIYFEELLKKGHFGGAYSNLIMLAANLFNGYLDIKEKPPFSPLELYRLDDSNFNVAMSAFIIRRHNWHIAAFMTDDEIVAKVEDLFSEDEEE